MIFEKKTAIIGTMIKVTGHLEIGSDLRTYNVVTNSLYVHGDMYVEDVNVNEGCRVDGNIKSINFTAGSVSCKGDIEATNIITTEDVVAKNIQCYFLRAMGDVIAEKIDTNGGPIYCGGEVRGEIVTKCEVHEHFTDWGNI